MAKNLGNLKFVIMKNWSSDPPTSMTLYYAAWGEKYTDLMEPVNEVADQLIGLLSESKDDDEAAELQDLLENCKPTAEDIRDFDFSTGWLGCACDCFAEGKDIIPKAAVFLEENFALDFYDDDEEEEENDDDDFFDDEEAEGIHRRALLKQAKENPEDYDTVVAFLNMILEFLESKNDEALCC